MVATHSRLAEFTRKQAELHRLEKEIEALKSNPEMVREMEFKEKLDELMSDYGKKSKDVVALLQPDASADGSNGETGKRAKRKLKKYRNPNTGEVVETRGGNHKTLKEWKAEYGSETVESWLESTE